MGLLEPKLNTKFVIFVVSIIKLIKTALIHVCLEIFDEPNMMCWYVNMQMITDSKGGFNWQCVSNCFSQNEFTVFFKLNLCVYLFVCLWGANMDQLKENWHFQICGVFICRIHKQQ